MRRSVESQQSSGEPVPGRRTAVQADLEPELDIRIEAMLVSLRRKTTVLEAAIRQVDYIAAWRAANDLTTTLAHAESTVAAVGGGELNQRVSAARTLAAPLLAVAPAPSPEAVREAVSRDRHASRATWNAEVARWRYARIAASLPSSTEPSSGDAGAADGRGERSTVGLPAVLKVELEQATGTDLDRVRLHGGALGARIAASHGARAVTIGADIYVGAGELDTTDAERLLVHETAHAAQALLPVPPMGGDYVGDPDLIEREAEVFTADFAVLRGTARFSPATRISSRQGFKSPPRPGLSHEQFEATADNRVSQAARAGKLLNAAAYLHLNARDVRTTLREYLAAHPVSLDDAQVHLVDGLGWSGLISSLLAPLENDDESAQVRSLRAWLVPVELDALVDRNRPIYEPARPSDTAEYTRGPKGPSSWRPAVGIAIGSALEVALSGSLPRMAGRLVAKTAELRSQTGRTAEQVRSASQLVPATPLDWRVANAMLGATILVEVVPGALQVVPSARMAYRKLRSVEWQGGRGGPWNAVRVEPEDATPEEVAAALLHSPTEAYRLRRIGQVYVLPEETAVAFQEARAARPAHVADAPSPEEQLAFGASAAAHADAEVRRVPGAVGVGPAGPAALFLAWQRIDEQLHGIASATEPHGFAGVLDRAVAFHAERAMELPRLTGCDAELRAVAFDQQRVLLSQIAAELAPLIAQLEGTRHNADPADPAHGTVRELLVAASLSHLPLTGRAAFAHAHELQMAALFDTLEAVLGQAATFVELAADAPPGRARASAAAFGRGLRERAEDLRGQLAGLRTRTLRGAATGEQAQDLYRKIDALRTDAQLIAQVGALAACFQVLDRLEESGWVLFSEVLTARPDEVSRDNQIGRLETARRGAAELRGALETVHSRWLKLQARGQAMGAIAAADGQEGGTPASAAIQAEVARVLTSLQAAGAKPNVQAFLRHAHDLAASAERRALITQIAVMVGVAIISEGAGAAAEGLYAGSRAVAITGAGSAAAALATRTAASRTLTTQLVGITANTITFTALQAALGDEPLLHAFANNFVTNLATYGALSGVRRVLGGISAGKAGLALWAARTANVTAPLLASMAVRFVQQECETALRKGRTMSWDELHTMTVQTIAMMVGSLIAHQMLDGTLRGVHLQAHELAARRAQRTQLEQLAKQVVRTGDPIQAIRLLRGARAYLDDLSSRDRTTEAGARVAAAKTQLNAIERGTLAAELGLDVVFPGQLYAGSREAVTEIAELYQQAGYYVAPTLDGYIVIENADSPRGRIQLLDRSRAQPGQRPPRPESTIPAHAESAKGLTSVIADGSPPRVDRPVPGLFASIDPTVRIADWEIHDFATRKPDGSTELKTKVSRPDGATGILYQTYNPITKRLTVQTAFLDQLPRWIAEAPPLVAGRGTPTVTYLMLRQLRMLGVEYGDAKVVRLTSVEEARTVIELGAMLGEGVVADAAILQTHTTAYTQTTLTQSGHRIAAAKVTLYGKRPLDVVLKRFEAPQGSAYTRAQREQRDPVLVEHHDQLIARFGRGKITRKTPVYVDFDVEYVLAPFSGSEATSSKSPSPPTAQIH